MYRKNKLSTADSLIPVEVKATDGATASLNNLLKEDKYPDIKYGIKFGYKNIGFNGKFYTFPYYLALLLKRFIAEGNKIDMEITTLLEYSERSQLRGWLQENHSKEKECWVVMSRSKTPPPGILPYIDVVEEALCFGWIDSTLKKLPDGRLAQRLSPRRKNSHWTKLNMDRCIDLEDRGLMTPAGRRALNFVDKRGRKTKYQF